MVPSRPKSKVYNCFIKLSGILHEIGFNHKETSMALSTAIKKRREMRCVYCDVIRKMHTKLASPSKKFDTKICVFHCDITETPNRPSLSICGQFTLRYTRVNAVWFRWPVFSAHRKCPRWICCFYWEPLAMNLL